MASEIEEMLYHGEARDAAKLIDAFTVAIICAGLYRPEVLQAVASYIEGTIGIDHETAEVRQAYVKCLRKIAYVKNEACGRDNTGTVRI